MRTGRSGAAAKAGHDLLIEVTSWEATVELGAAASVALDADGESLRVLEGTGGITQLDDDDRASIRQTIHDEVLQGTAVSFRSSEVVAVDGGRFSVHGDLTLLGRSHPVSFELILDEHGRLSASAVLRQTDWGIKPYSALFGALKVADEVTVSFEGGPLDAGA